MDDFNEITADKSKDYLVCPAFRLHMTRKSFRVLDADYLASIALDQEAESRYDCADREAESSGHNQAHFDASVTLLTESSRVLSLPNARFSPARRITCAEALAHPYLEVSHSAQAAPQGADAVLTPG